MSTSPSSAVSPGHALAWVRQQSDHGPGLGPGWCERGVRLAYSLDAVYPDAASNISELVAAGRLHGTSRKPVGATVWWTGGSHGHGHVALASHHVGLIWSLDVRRAGFFDLVEEEYPEREWGLEPVGWSAFMETTRVIGAETERRFS